MLDRPLTRAGIAAAVVAFALGSLPDVVSAQSRVDDLIDARVEWHDVMWSGGRLSVALIRPDPETPGPHPVVFGLPWGSGTPDLVETFVASYWLTEPARRGYYVVVPVGLGPALARTADEVIPAIFTWMDGELEYDATRVALVGASNGGRGAFFAALSQPDRFRALMVMPGQYGGPAEDLAVLADKPIYFMVGALDDRWVESTQATRVALESHGIASALWIAPGQGHVIRVNPRPLLDWIDSALER